MEGERIDKHGDQGPYLFGIPTPVSAPRHVGPNGAYKDAGGEQEDGGIEQDAADDRQVFNLLVVATMRKVEDDGGDTVEHREGQQRIGYHDDHHMNAQQGRLEHGDEVGDAGIALANHGYHHRQTADEKAEGEGHGKPMVEEEGEHGGAGGHEHHGLEPVGEGKVTAHIAAQTEVDDEVEGAERQQEHEKLVAALLSVVAHQLPTIEGKGEQTEGDKRHGQRTVDVGEVVYLLGLETGGRREADGFLLLVDLDFLQQGDGGRVAA